MQTKAHIRVHLHDEQENDFASTQIISRYITRFPYPVTPETASVSCLFWVTISNLTQWPRAELKEGICATWYDNRPSSLYLRWGTRARTEEAGGEDGRFITTASATHNSRPLEPQQGALRVIFFPSPPHTHIAFGHLNTVTAFISRSALLSFPSTLHSPFPILCHLSAASIPSMLTPSTSFTVISTVMISPSFFPSLLHMLSLTGRVSESRCHP